MLNYKGILMSKFIQSLQSNLLMKI